MHHPDAEAGGPPPFRKKNHSIECFAFSGDDFIQKFRLFPFPQLTISFTAATTQIYTRLFEKFGTGLLVPIRRVLRA